MGIRIQPREIDVPEDDPFKNDLLSRREPAEVLTHLVGVLEGPCVLAVDAAWGAGKTTFLNIWSQHLRNNRFPVVKFNAWETDHAGDPFVALSSELTKGLREYEGPDKGLAEKITNAATEVVRWVNPGLVQSAIAGIPVPIVAPSPCGPRREEPVQIPGGTEVGRGIQGCPAKHGECIIEIQRESTPDRGD